MNKLFKVAAAIALTSPFTGAFAANDADMAAKLERLERIVMEQNNRLEKQESEIATLRGEGTEVRALVADLAVEQEELDGALDARIEDGLAALKDSSSISLGKGVDGLTLKSDARFRYQLQDEGKSSDDERLRLRLRLGGVWQNKAEDWEFGAGFEVGSSSADSANASFNEGGTFESLDVYADYAYAKHKMDAFSLTVGQMKNPLETTNMLWDGDVRPVGVAAQFEDAGMFATVAWFDAVAGDGNNTGVVGTTRDRYQADGNLLLGQVGFINEGEDAEYGVALGYMVSNEPFDTYAEGYTDEDNDLQVADLYGWFGTSAGDVDLTLFGHVAMNFGADGAVAGGIDPSDEDMAYALGIEAALSSFKLGYIYKHIEAFATSATLNDSDFGDVAGGTTNVEGHTLKASYKISKNVSFGVTALLEEQIVGSKDGETYQFDLKYKF